VARSNQQGTVSVWRDSPGNCGPITNLPHPPADDVLSQTSSGCFFSLMTILENDRAYELLVSTVYHIDLLVGKLDATIVLGFQAPIAYGVSKVIS
jgi:hypothetical protein